VGKRRRRTEREGEKGKELGCGRGKSQPEGKKRSRPGWARSWTLFPSLFFF
jgi:hypothetical protein